MVIDIACLAKDCISYFIRGYAAGNYSAMTSYYHSTLLSTDTLSVDWLGLEFGRITLNTNTKGLILSLYHFSAPIHDCAASQDRIADIANCTGG